MLRETVGRDRESMRRRLYGVNTRSQALWKTPLTSLIILGTATVQAATCSVASTVHDHHRIYSINYNSKHVNGMRRGLRISNVVGVFYAGT